MSRQVARVAWFRFRATFRTRWVGYLSVVLLVGFVGGLAMASVAAARRTQSSFPAYLATLNPSDIDLITGRGTPRSTPPGTTPLWSTRSPISHT